MGVSIRGYSPISETAIDTAMHFIPLNSTCVPLQDNHVEACPSPLPAEILLTECIYLKALNFVGFSIISQNSSNGYISGTGCCRGLKLWERSPCRCVYM